MSSPAPSDAAAEQLRRVQVVTDAALAHLTLERLLDELLVRVRELLDVDTAAVLLLDRTRRELVATAAKGIEEEVDYRVRIPLGGGFAGAVAERGRPIVIDSVDRTKVLNPILVEAGIRSLLGVPLIEEGAVLGVLHVGTLTPRRFTDHDIEVLQLVADRVALAVRARIEEGQRLTAETLQRSLLPDRLPSLAGFDVAATYVPAHGQMVGGDWYDVFVLPGDRLAVVIGDVAGRGLSAAAVMARLRSAVRAYALLGLSPGDIVSRANDLMFHFEPDEMVTMIVALIDREGGFEFVNAGHVPPLVAHPGEARFVDGSVQPCLGASRGHQYRNRSERLSPGDALVLYTDGLVERRNRSLDDGLDRLQETISAGWRNLEEVSRAVLGPDGDGGEDDLALLVIRFRPDPDPSRLSMTIVTDPHELFALRRRLRAWLSVQAIDPQGIQDVLVAASEAAANAMEHAYAPRQGVIELECRLEEGAVVVEVRDRGLWRPQRISDQGRGIMLMQALMDDVAIRTEATGTRVLMRKDLQKVSS